jgi:uncharacterized membrane protein YhaH (DUF805 family)
MDTTPSTTKKSLAKAIISGMTDWWRITGRTTRYDFWALYLFLCFLMLISHLLASPALVSAAQAQNLFLFDLVAYGLSFFNILLGVALIAAMIRRVRDAGGWIYCVPLLMLMSFAIPVSLMIDMGPAGLNAAQPALPEPSAVTLMSVATWLILVIYCLFYLARRSKPHSPREKASEAKA